MPLTNSRMAEIYTVGSLIDHTNMYDVSRGFETQAPGIVTCRHQTVMSVPPYFVEAPFVEILLKPQSGCAVLC
jgi:hypothetical protein